MGNRVKPPFGNLLGINVTGMETTLYIPESYSGKRKSTLAESAGFLLSLERKKFNSLFKLLYVGAVDVEVLTWSQRTTAITLVNLNAKKMNMSIPPSSGPAAGFMCLLIFYECSCTLCELHVHSLIHSANTVCKDDGSYIHGHDQQKYNLLCSLSV